MNLSKQLQITARRLRRGRLGDAWIESAGGPPEPREELVHTIEPRIRPLDVVIRRTHEEEIATHRVGATTLDIEARG